MKAIAARQGSLQPEIVEIDEPESPQADQVLCRTVELGICGTDRDIIGSGQPWTPPGSEYLVLGHECLAQIQEVGAGVTRFAIGDYVVPLVRRAKFAGCLRPDMLPPGQYIERGIFSAHGFAAPCFVDDEAHLLPVQPHLLPWAVLAEPVSITEKAVHEAMRLAQARSDSRSTSGDAPKVLVTGQGPIAMAGVISARSRGWDCTVFGRDQPDTSRAELVCRLGAHYQRWDDWRWSSSDFNPSADERGFDLILECTGNEEAMLAAAPWLRTLGIMVWVGAPWEPRPKSLALAGLMRDAILRNQILLGTVNAAVRDFESAFECLDWLRRQEIQPDDLITERVSAQESLALYCSRPEQSIKSVVSFDGWMTR